MGYFGHYGQVGLKGLFPCCMPLTYKSLGFQFGEVTVIPVIDCDPGLWKSILEFVFVVR